MAPCASTRRLDGGRREVLDVRAPAVLSVEGAVARLRRASVPAELAARQATDRASHRAAPARSRSTISSHPYRPRPRVLAAPTGDALERVRRLTDAAGAAVASHGDAVTLAPPEAAERILASLVQWGYLDG